MNYPFKKAVVTGGAGFIGSHLCERLVNLGVNVICIDDFSAGKMDNIEHLADKKNFTVEPMDVRDPEIGLVLDEVDVVFHNAASKKNICLNYPKRDLEVNAGGTLNLLLASIDKGVKKFVHASTGSVYGEGKEFPQTEHHPLNPCSYYGVSKLAGEKYVSMFGQTTWLNTTILRYFHVYGPRQDCGEFGGVVSIFINKMLNNKNITVFGSGLQERTFTYVDDVVEANIQASINGVAKNEVYNCASGIKVTINELVDYLKNIIKPEKCTVKYTSELQGDIFKFDVDNNKIKHDLKIDFLTDIKAGLEKTVESFR